jgi:hypothetical protein
MKISFKNKIFEIKKLRIKNINKNYVYRTNSLFLVNNIQTIRKQKEYVKKLRLKKNEIFQITYKKKLIASSGFQFSKLKLFQGILIIDKRFLGKGYAKFFILSAALCAQIIFKRRLIFAGINNSNNKSRNAFLAAGFKIIKKYKHGVVLLLDLCKNNNKLKSEIKIL